MIRCSEITETPYYYGTAYRIIEPSNKMNALIENGKLDIGRPIYFFNRDGNLGESIYQFNPPTINDGIGASYIQYFSSAASFREEINSNGLVPDRDVGFKRIKEFINDIQKIKAMYHIEGSVISEYRKI